MYVCELPSFLIYVRLRYSFVSNLRTPADSLLFSIYVIDEPADKTIKEPINRTANESADLLISLRMRLLTSLRDCERIY
jgi:hypothetical protein